ncbi:hypothetical protein AMAG_09346 [Allomyces macrogynus ATCC 38327]|uniref:BHLH domain-containing protein n=1 Tax=Allomyces macrogynus (strain ATCC 38327) TaxID=578462 RepID=A0A0L0SPA1_ALLM3|nr:hypothetical protein AMAG_09346 [Allomyces macrogynus ATCC 38327]|eukprot:KNE64317.1 hypothetical protein AMAG_09346 [Allomyces macrogynus ATCC 38327]
MATTTQHLAAATVQLAPAPHPDPSTLAGPGQQHQRQQHAPPAGVPPGAPAAARPDSNPMHSHHPHHAPDDPGHAGAGAAIYTGPTEIYVDDDMIDDEEPPLKRKRGRPRKVVYTVSGVNILNQPVATEEEQQEHRRMRRENHNIIERRRRDQINQSILDLSDLLPLGLHKGAALNKATVLRLTVELVRHLTAQSEELILERNVMRNLLLERGVDWKTVEVAIAHQRAAAQTAGPSPASSPGLNVAIKPDPDSLGPAVPVGYHAGSPPASFALSGAAMASVIGAAGPGADSPMPHAAAYSKVTMDTMPSFPSMTMIPAAHYPTHTSSAVATVVVAPTPASVAVAPTMTDSVANTSFDCSGCPQCVQRAAASQSVAPFMVQQLPPQQVAHHTAPPPGPGPTSTVATAVTLATSPPSYSSYGWPAGPTPAPTPAQPALSSAPYIIASTPAPPPTSSSFITTGAPTTAAFPAYPVPVAISPPHGTGRIISAGSTAPGAVAPAAPTTTTRRLHDGRAGDVDPNGLATGHQARARAPTQADPAAADCRTRHAAAPDRTASIGLGIELGIGIGSAPWRRRT